MTALVNLTPHAVTVVLPSGDTVTLPPSGTVARCSTCSTSSEVVEEVNGIPVSRVSYGEVVGLPEATEGTMFVVSALVRSAVPHRKDVASPGDLVRDAGGNVVGCKGLVVN